MIKSARNEKGEDLNLATGKNKGGGRCKTPTHKAKLIANAVKHNTRNMEANEAKKAALGPHLSG